MQKFLFELALRVVASLYNFHRFIDLDQSSVTHVTASAALTLSDNNRVRRLLWCISTKLHVATNRKAVFFIVDVVIIFNRTFGRLEVGPLPQRIEFNLRTVLWDFCYAKYFWYTPTNKNPSVWNFLSPELEVTWRTVAFIIRVVLLAPYFSETRG